MDDDIATSRNRDDAVVEFQLNLAFERIYIRPRAFWEEKRVELVLGRSVKVVDPTNKTVKLDVGSARTYDSLIWATGGNPRQLAVSGCGLGGVNYVQNRADADAIISEQTSVERVVVIGGS